jgi:hypothetical protein
MRRTKFPVASGFWQENHPKTALRTGWEVEKRSFAVQRSGAYI